jgi:hypothetical protein
MFTTLLESGRRLQWALPRPTHSALSLAAHGVALAGVLGAGDARPPDRSPPSEGVTYAAPRFRVVAEPPPRSERRSTRHARVASTLPTGATVLRTPRAVADPLPPISALDAGALTAPVVADVLDDALDPTRLVPSSDELAIPASDAMLAAALRGRPPVPGSAADLFERGLVALDANPAPRYPRRLLDAAIEGAVRVTFVVDSTGRADSRSMRVLYSTDALFTRAVHQVLPRLRYRAARSGALGAPILAEQLFVFAIR